MRLSAPIIFALYSRLSVKVTMTSSAPSTTCALVITKPSDVRIKPEPTPRGWASSCGAGERSGRGLRGVPGVPGVKLGGMGIPKRLKNSSICSSAPPPPLAAAALDFSEVRMFTTDGETCSTRSVKSGKVRFCAQTGVAGTSDANAQVPTMTAAAVKRHDFFINTNIVDLIELNLENTGAHCWGSVM